MVFDLLGYMSHDNALEAMISADALLLTLTDLPGASHIIPGKTFEYMATGKHIVALIPEGETKKKLIRDFPK